MCPLSHTKILFFFFLFFLTSDIYVPDFEPEYLDREINPRSHRKYFIPDLFVYMRTCGEGCKVSKGIKKNHSLVLLF